MANETEGKVVIERIERGGITRYNIKAMMGRYVCGEDSRYFIVKDDHYLLFDSFDKILGVVDKDKRDEAEKRVYEEARRIAVKFINYHSRYGYGENYRNWKLEDRTGVERFLL